MAAILVCYGLEKWRSRKGRPMIFLGTMLVQPSLVLLKNIFIRFLNEVLC